MIDTKLFFGAQIPNSDKEILEKTFKADEYKDTPESFFQWVEYVNHKLPDHVYFDVSYEEYKMETYFNNPDVVYHLNILDKDEYSLSDFNDAMLDAIYNLKHVLVFLELETLPIRLYSRGYTY
jgi:hypothetical protein